MNTVVGRIAVHIHDIEFILIASGKSGGSDGGGSVVDWERTATHPGCRLPATATFPTPVCRQASRSVTPVCPRAVTRVYYKTREKKEMGRRNMLDLQDIDLRRKIFSPVGTLFLPSSRGRYILQEARLISLTSSFTWISLKQLEYGNLKLTVN